MHRASLLLVFHRTVIRHMTIFLYHVRELIFSLIDFLPNSWIVRENGILLPKNQAILVTGCDSGIGKRLAIRLAENGVNTFAACLTAEGAKNLTRSQILFENSDQKSQKLKSDDLEARNLVEKTWQSVKTLFSNGHDENSGISKMDNQKCCKVKLENVIPFRMDISSKMSVEEGADYVQKIMQLKGFSLHAIVANAGVSNLPIPIDWLSMGECEKILKVNLSGTIRTIQNFHPLLTLEENTGQNPGQNSAQISDSRKDHHLTPEGQNLARKSNEKNNISRKPVKKNVSKRIILVSSAAGFLPVPRFSPYCASKFGLLGFAEELRLQNPELKICLIAPGYFPTPGSKAHTIDSKTAILERFAHLEPGVRESYSKKDVDNWANSMKNTARRSKSNNLDDIFTILCQAITAKQPRNVYFVGAETPFVQLLAILPDIVKFWILKRFVS